MTALTADRAVARTNIKTVELGATADTYYQGAAVCWDTSVNRVVVAQTSTTLDPIGTIPYQQVVATNGDPLVVELPQEKMCVWFVNSAGDAVSSTEVGDLVYLEDDQTVAASSSSGTLSAAGRCWKVDTVRGVLVELSGGAQDVNEAWVHSVAGAAAGTIADAGALITATTIEGALAENRTALDTLEAEVGDYTGGGGAEADVATGVIQAEADILELEAGEVLQSRTVTITPTELTAAAVSQTINCGAALPANAVVIATTLNVATLFSGGGASAVTADVGGTDTDCICDGHDIFTGAATGLLSPSTLGVRWAGAFASEQLSVTITSDVNVSTLTAGSLTVTVYFLAPTD